MLSKSDTNFSSIVISVVNSSRFHEMKKYNQHGNTNTMLHSIAVAYYSSLFVNRVRLRCDKRSLVRGALLHDYFLYDWHVSDKTHNFHGFRHPGTALSNANNDYRLNSIEKNIIARHMFPLVPVPPKNREAYIVCLVDKACSLYEIFKKNGYSSLRAYCENVNIY